MTVDIKCNCHPKNECTPSPPQPWQGGRTTSGSRCCCSPNLRSAKILHVTCYRASLYVVHFKRLLNFGEGRCGACSRKCPKVDSFPTGLIAFCPDENGEPRSSQE